jgi:hypothetical protein
MKSKHIFSVQQLFFFPPKVAPFMKYVEKYGGVRGATYDVTTWRICFACWISKATRTHSHAHTHTYTLARTDSMQYLLLPHGNNNSRTHFSVTLYVHWLSCFFFLGGGGDTLQCIFYDNFVNCRLPMVSQRYC